MKKFTRTIEDFSCEHCGAHVVGNGYTNHCPKCLWSKHVDINPGDRAAICGGMMKPIKVEQASGGASGKTGRVGYAIIHRCERCGIEKKNRIAPEDDFDALAAIQSAN